jgi:hypothetical protein
MTNILLALVWQPLTTTLEFTDLFQLRPPAPSTAGKCATTPDYLSTRGLCRHLPVGTLTLTAREEGALDNWRTTAF